MSGDIPMPRIAVVLCTHNGARFLQDQFASLRAQSMQPHEYVLSDDASTDGTWELLQVFAHEEGAAGRSVTLHRNPEALGYVRHFEQALQRATAEVLFPCDQDDIWHAGKIARMTEEFGRRPGLLMLHGDARLVDASGGDLGKRLFDVLEVISAERAAMHAGGGFEVLLRRNIVTGAAMAVRREVVALARPFPADWAHDEWMAMIAAMHGAVDMLEEIVIDYRQHAGNQIGVKERTTLQRHMGYGVSRRAYLQRQVVRLQELLGHVDSAAVPDHHREPVAQRLEHARSRSSLPPRWIARLHHVLREWRSGRYRRFGSGWRSALVDVLGID